jgi:hypothetical protein
MNEFLEPLLDALRRESVPQAGLAFNRGVWRLIEARRSEAGWSWVLKPRVVVAALALAVMFGAVGALLPSRSEVRTKAAFGLDVFSPAPKYLPSGILARFR